MKALNFFFYTCLFFLVGELIIRIDLEYDILNNSPYKIEVKIEKEVIKASKRFGADFDKQEFVTTNSRVLERQKKISYVNNKMNTSFYSGNLEEIKNLINSDTFLSKVLELDIDGKKEKVIPRDVAFHVVSEEPIHIDCMRGVSGKKIILEIPVKFINHPESPGLKKGGVLNIVRRAVELKCPAENIPNDITIDLSGTDIGTSLKISSVTLPVNVRVYLLWRTTLR